MKKINFDYLFIAQIAFSAFLFIIAFVGIITLYSKGTEFIKENKSLVGSEVVIKEDTLMIIDYILTQDSYILEDNRRFDRKFIWTQTKE